MKITYIHHSCFSVELDKSILIFDYFKGELPNFDKNKKLYIFSSHSHHDHFNESIFKLEKTYPDVTYILSDDIKAPKSKNIKFISPNEELLLDDIEIKTLESSDLGVAFIVTIEDKAIYHAGDLNWWHWEWGNSPEENKYAENKFKDAINRIKGKNFDIAFLPLDPRQGDQYYLGFDYFMRNTNTKAAFPMHLWDDYSLPKTFISSKYASNYKYKVFEINHKNEIFNI